MKKEKNGAGILSCYMNEISNYNLLTEKDEKDLARKIHGRNPALRSAAMETLITANLRLVVKIAHDFHSFGVEFPELVSEGNIGLAHAAEKFDPKKGAKFSSYASWWIKQSMRRAIADQKGAVRVPIQSAARMRKIRAAVDVLTEELGRPPTNEEIGARTGMTERMVSALRRLDCSTVSLHDPVSSEGETELMEIIPAPASEMPGSAIGDSDSFLRLDEALGNLTRRERLVIELRYGLAGRREPMTLEEVSSKIGRTRERVRQIQRNAMDKLRGLLSGEERCAMEA